MTPVAESVVEESAALPPAPLPGLHDDEHGNLSARPRVLMATHRTPFPLDKGDRIRSYHVLRHFAKQASVDLVTFADEPVSRSTVAALRRLTNEAIYVPATSKLRWLRAVASLAAGGSATQGLFYSRQMQRCLQSRFRAARYDLVYVTCSSMAQYLPPKEAGSPRTVVDLIDVDSQKWLDYAAGSKGPKRLLYSLEARRVRALEQSLSKRCDLLTVVTEDEAACFRAFDAAAPLAVLPNGVDSEYFHPNADVQPRPYSCVFVGALDYKPNVEAVEWFCRHVWPQIVAWRPSAVFSIVGRKPTAAVRSLTTLPGVRLLADVADVRPALWEASVVVAPLLIARGVQNKVLEAIAAAKAVVVSSSALAGLSAKHGEHVLVANKAEEWVSSLQTAMENEQLTSKIGTSARRFIVRHHDWAQSLEKLNTYLTSGRPNNEGESLT